MLMKKIKRFNSRIKMIMIEKYSLCLGHIAYKRKECEKCIRDSYNTHCPYYEPITIFPVSITGDEPIDQHRNNDGYSEES